MQEQKDRKGIGAEKQQLTGKVIERQGQGYWDSDRGKGKKRGIVTGTGKEREGE